MEIEIILCWLNGDWLWRFGGVGERGMQVECIGSGKSRGGVGKGCGRW